MKKLTIQAMRQLAENHGGKCLSDVYVGSESKLSWRCAKGHEWMAVHSHVRNGSWCPFCAGKAKLTIQHMHRLAETRGGRCVSDVYVSALSKLTWECAKGHRWMATPNNIQQGTWCPKCVGLAKLTID